MKKAANHNIILIVEDDAIVASQLQRTLNKMGYSSIGPVASGSEAVELALNSYPALILMDIKLKGEMTGIEAADAIHKESDIPVVYLTAYADSETIERSKDKHTYGFLTKPVREKELGAMIEMALYKSNTDKSLKHLNQLLKAIRAIDKLITIENDPAKLLSSACQVLVDSKDYILCWLSNEKNTDFSTIAASLKLQSVTSLASLFRNSNKKIKDIIDLNLNTSSSIILRDNSAAGFLSVICPEHNLKTVSSIICHIKHREKFYGYLTIFSDKPASFDVEEQELLQTLATDLAFALHSIELESDRAKAEKSLRESEAYYRSLLHNMHEDIIVIDKNFNIVDTNTSVLKTTGHLASEILGRKCHQVFNDSNYEGSSDSNFRELEKVFEEGIPSVVRHKHISKDGKPVHVEVLYSPIKDEKGSVVKVIESIHDVTNLLTAQDALMESEERTRQIADSIDSVLFTLKSDEKGERLVYLSPAFDRVWGIDRNAAIKDSTIWLDSIYLKDRRKLIEAIQLAKPDLSFNDRVEFRIVRSDGSTRWISSNFKRVNSYDGSYNIIGIAEDITDRILTETKLKRSEQGYKNLFENAHDTIIIFEPDRGIILNTNVKASAEFGYDKNEFMGKSFYELCYDGRTVFEKINDAADSKNVPTFELHAIKKDKSGIYFETNLSLTDYIGQKAIIAINRNITFRKNAEKELRILSEIVKQSPAAVLLTDTNNVIEYANSRYTELTGYALKEIIGKPAPALKPVEGLSLDEIWKAVKDGNIWSGEVMKVKKSRFPYWASLLISPIKNSEGIITHFLSIEQDISQQKELEVELKMALNKANEINVFKTHLLGNLNHEIRTPMNSIIGFAQIMSDESQDQDVIVFSNKIIKSSYRLLNTLNSIIELSDLESERIKVNKTVINLSHFIRYLDYSYRSIVKEKNLSLDIEIAKEDFVINSDEKLLEQSLKNLLDNAIKYTESGGIKILAEEIIDSDEKKYCAIRIKDTGIGIPEKNRNLIFDAFRQLSEGVTRKYEGTGLGLTISQKMVKLIGGRIDFESQLNEGSTFSIILPFIIDDTSTGKTSISKGVIKQKGSLKTDAPNILIVEDYLMNVDIMRYFLSDLAKMDNTTNFEETLAAVQKKIYDIILMDINLKNSIGGIELMKEIRKLNTYSTIPIIAITGYTSSMDQDTFIKEGFDGFLAKPFTQQQLKNVINKHINLFPQNKN